ncbi:MAG: aldehyde-activating protein [Myxococcales bacterium 68-20]|nr:GFA family protein [Myxococcales bacterium]OJY29922.1 MAG: aldehyde-activating protein [Myxococcales bacterium 68-20]
MRSESSRATSPEATGLLLEGGCHCGRVRFRVRTSERRALDCNCSMCGMKGFLHLIVTKDAFELLSGSEAITTYTWGTHVAKHTFCRFCGVHPFYTPRSHPDGVDVNVRCLDGDAASRFVVEPFDGKEWEANVDRIR